jgi:hypothetical protein
MKVLGYGKIGASTQFKWRTTWFLFIEVARCQFEIEKGFQNHENGYVMSERKLK